MANETDRNAGQCSLPDDIIEAGEVEGLDEDIPFHEGKLRAETARRLAEMLLWILAGSVIFHYVMTAVILECGKESTVENLSKIFNVWLPVISGLMGSAATYYFTKEK
jgi:hypothetical protein